MTAIRHRETRGSQVWVSKEGLWVVALGKDPDGIRLVTKPIFAFTSGCSAGSVGLAVKRAIEASGHLIRRGSFETLKRIIHRDTGRTWGSFARRAALLSIEGTSEEFHLQTNRHQGSTEGFVATKSDPTFRVARAVSAATLGAAIFNAVQVELYWPQVVTPKQQRVSPKRRRAGA